MNEQIENEIKKVTMAGVGMAASVAEKTKDVIDKYSTKGEQVVNKSSNSTSKLQQKVNQFAKEPIDSVKNAVDTVKEKADDVIDSAKQKLSDSFH